ncbi:major facilitator superfamily domain-containing protein [Kalaharituber pfeilii]|nr:major facilitator superfamily domain-containing protein [Kalaharituber pfeilii]
MGISVLWTAPEINPINKKARAVPMLNPINLYGRTFFFSTFGFMIAFMSWYAWTPLLSKTIKKDLHLSQTEVANSNVLALTATLLVRVIVGPLCDRFGPRLVYIGLLLAGAVPTVMAGLVTSARGVMAIRFFVGILGGTFVPCQVWSMQFYDKNVVGTANALMAGIGNAGGGITYFVMPAIFDSLVKYQGLTEHVAWRVSFIVPFCLITTTALGMLFLCEDTPTGKWADRNKVVSTPNASSTGVVVDLPNNGKLTMDAPAAPSNSSTSDTTNEKKIDKEAAALDICEGSIEAPQLGQLEIARAEVVKPPTFKDGLRVFCSLQCMMLALPYACSFGGELAINAILGAYYMSRFPTLTQTTSGQWAAMFGLLNVFFRPFGGMISDIIYRYTNHSVSAKKFWLVFLGVSQGAMCLAIGLLNTRSQATMFGLVAGLAFFMDASNGANFAVVPHVFPQQNGILSGFVGATGNLGGVIFALIFRFNGTNYSRVIWIIGVICVAVNIGISWIRVIPKGQIGGR